MKKSRGGVSRARPENIDDVDQRIVDVEQRIRSLIDKADRQNEDVRSYPEYMRLLQERTRLTVRRVLARRTGGKTRRSKKFKKTTRKRV
jgi:hypothetical protein